MRRSLLLAVLLSLVTAAAAHADGPPPTAVPAASGDPVPVVTGGGEDDAVALDAELTSCAAGGDPADTRSAVFTGSMPLVAGARRMAMRFELRRRPVAGGPLETVEVPGWSAWVRAQPGRPAFVYSRRVAGLAPGSAYVAVVQFRWYGRTGRVLRSARRTTAPCAQPDPRPDLVAGALSAVALDDTTATYTLTLRNAGAAAAAATTVAVTFPGLAPLEVPAPALAPGAAQRITFAAPRCVRDSTVLVTPDAGGVVDEAVEDGAASRPCPA